MNAINKVLGALTGEFLLLQFPNGGTVVLLRSLLTGSLVYVFAVVIHALLHTGFGTRVDWNSIHASTKATLPWAGAILGAVYAALYARFASQWNYLAGVYNQLMATQAQAPVDLNPERTRVYTYWKAGIVEDAYVLHLAGKPMFAPLIASLIADAAVVAVFNDTAVDAERSLRKLEAILTVTLRKEVRANRGRQLPAEQ